jgi:hypothetical protein
MLKNLGTVDRQVRLVAAVVLAGVALFAANGALAWVLGLVAVVLAATSALGTCPAYALFGFTTRRETRVA